MVVSSPLIMISGITFTVVPVYKYVVQLCAKSGKMATAVSNDSTDHIHYYYSVCQQNITRPFIIVKRDTPCF